MPTWCSARALTLEQGTISACRPTAAGPLRHDARGSSDVKGDATYLDARDAGPRRLHCAGGATALAGEMGAFAIDDDWCRYASRQLLFT